MNPQSDISLKVVAQLAMDLFYQGLRGEEQFLRIEHFQMLCANAYAALIEQEFRQMKILSKQETGFSAVQLSPDWIREVNIVVKKNKTNNLLQACLPDKIISFSFDYNSSGVQGVFPVNPNTGQAGCNEFVKISANDVWKLKLMPNTAKTFFYVSGNTIYFEKPACNLENKKVRVTYAPQINAFDKNAYVPKSKQEDITTRALQFALSSKDGNVEKLSNDQNPNGSIQTEIDKNQLKQ